MTHIHSDLVIGHKATLDEHKTNFKIILNGEEICCKSEPTVSGDGGASVLDRPRFEGDNIILPPKGKIKIGNFEISIGDDGRLFLNGDLEVFGNLKVHGDMIVAQKQQQQV